MGLGDGGKIPSSECRAGIPQAACSDRYDVGAATFRRNQTPSPITFFVPAFLGAGLLFVVEPMLAKWLLPTLGGNPATWSACLVSFQILLLAGYGYARLSTRRFSVQGQVSVHLVLVLGAGLSLLGTQWSAAPALGALPPALSIPWLLLGRIGLPYVVLASTAPLLSRWAATTPRRQTQYIYAASNAGALVGLLAYPFLVEPFLDVRVQLASWAGAFLLFALTMAPACVTARRVRTEPPSVRALEPRPVPSAADRFRWLAYAFVPSMMLLAATNHITVDVAATPLLWVVPLALYLVSFIVAFGAGRTVFRGAVLFVWIAGALGVSLNAYLEGSASLFRQVTGTLLALFGSCMLCHGELAKERPLADELTGYYLVVAWGGALGGAFVALIAPLVFADYYELELGAMATFFVLLLASRPGGRNPWPRAERVGLLLGCGLCLPLLFYGVLVRLESEGRDGRIVERRRSFLGPLRVVDVAEGRILTHGRIQHGMQLRAPALRRTPTLYFGSGTGLERALDGLRPDRARRIGVIGLGVGTIAAYGRSGDTLRFYELDANVVDIARRDFTFLADSAARIDVVLGDGRLSLSREPLHAFDVLVIDAFSSDAVPVHLLTREAFSLYAAELAPDGLLLVNVSNRHLAVDRVVLAAARAEGLACAFVETPTDPARHVSHVEWALAARDPRVLARLVGDVPTVEPAKPGVLWTDSRASLFSIVR